MVDARSGQEELDPLYSGIKTLGSELRKQSHGAMRAQPQRRMNAPVNGQTHQVVEAAMSSGGVSSSSGPGRHRRNQRKPGGSPSPSPVSQHEGIPRSRTSPALRGQADLRSRSTRQGTGSSSCAQAPPQEFANAGSSGEVFDAAAATHNDARHSPAKAAARSQHALGRIAPGTVDGTTPRVPKRTPRQSPRSAGLVFTTWGAPPSTARGLQAQLAKAEARARHEGSSHGGLELEGAASLNTSFTSSCPDAGMATLSARDGASEGFCDGVPTFAAASSDGAFAKADQKPHIAARRAAATGPRIEADALPLAASSASGRTTPTDNGEAASLRMRSMDGKDASRIMRLIGKRSVLNHASSGATVDSLPQPQQVQQRRRPADTNKAWQRVQPHRHQTQHRLLPLQSVQHHSSRSSTGEPSQQAPAEKAQLSSASSRSNPPPGPPGARASAGRCPVPVVPAIHLEVCQKDDDASAPSALQVTAAGTQSDGGACEEADSPSPIHLPSSDCSEAKPTSSVPVCNISLIAVEEAEAPVVKAVAVEADGSPDVPAVAEGCLAASHSRPAVEEAGDVDSERLGANDVATVAHQDTTELQREDAEAEHKDRRTSYASAPSMADLDGQIEIDAKNEEVTSPEPAGQSPSEGSPGDCNANEHAVIWPGLGGRSQQVDANGVESADVQDDEVVVEAATVTAWAWPSQDATATEESNPEDARLDQQDRAGLQIWPGRQSSPDVMLQNEAGSVILPNTWRYVLPSQQAGVPKALIAAAGDGYTATIYTDQGYAQREEDGTEVSEVVERRSEEASVVDELTFTVVQPRDGESKAPEPTAPPALEPEAPLGVASSLAQVDYKSLEGLTRSLDLPTKRALVGKLVEAYLSRASVTPEIDMALKSEQRSNNALRIVLEGLHRQNTALQQQLAMMSQGSPVGTPAAHSLENAPESSDAAAIKDQL
mmetsp:Transcript_58173/g.138487  ORF Transcript_58173/g.138487 Transcript_58173/m.138487 type:complete len:944 (-) Transcript_58173:58-2889(-)